MPELFTLKDVAAALKLTTATLYNWAKAGKLHFIKVGGVTRISKAEIDRLLEAGSQPATPGKEDGK